MMSLDNLPLKQLSLQLPEALFERLETAATQKQIGLDDLVGQLLLNALSQMDDGCQSGGAKALDMIPSPEKKRLPARDRVFMERLDALIDRNIGNPDFSVSDIITSFSDTGRTTFYKKLNRIIGQAPNAYLRARRMKRAADLLASGDMNISEVAYAIGMNDPLYFSKCFRAYYGMSPTQYRKSL